MNERHSLPMLTGVLAACLVALAATGCGEGTVEPPPPPPPTVPTTLTVSPTSATLQSLGETAQLTAEVRDQNGQAMANAAVAWTSSDPSVATVAASGLVTAVANGAATVTATAGSASGTAAVTVDQVVAAVVVDPAADTLQAFGDTLRLSAEALDANGNVVTGAEFAWESSDASVATVDVSGLLTAVANGVATVTATAGAVSASAEVTVDQVVAAVVVDPAADTLQAFGDTLRLSAEALDANGNVVTGAEFAWESSDASVATVDVSGLLTAVANGVATVTATAGAVSASAEVTVDQVAVEVVMDPAADTLLAFGDTLRLSAAALDANGNVVAGAEFVWASGDTLVAVVDQQGLVTGGAAGEVEVTATSADMTGRAQLAVLVPTPAMVAIEPDTVGLNALGQTARLAAEVRDRAGRAMEGVAVSWSSGDTLVATVDSAGLVTAAGNGTTTVAATADSASGQAAVTVMQSAGSIVLSPATDTVSPGDTVRLAASAFDGNGHVIDATEFDWSSSDVSVARVDASGLVTALAEGRTTVTAATGDVQGTAAISVENPDRAALVALYEATDGPNWLDSENWLTDAPLDEWYGVDTDSFGRVVGLELTGAWDSDRREWSSHGLSGRIPAELAQLRQLRRLNLGSNDLYGSIPPELGQLATLTWLSLHSNNLRGQIPSELANLASLEGLILRNNNLSGPIPPELGGLADLRRLSLEWNGSFSGGGLTGTIPPELGRLVDLRELGLGGNELSGTIPPELAQLLNLWRLDLRENLLSGPIPSGLGEFADLEWLYLDGNNLSGSLPRDFTKLRELTQFWFFDNQGLCAPGDSEFVGWLGRIEAGRSDRAVRGPYCNEAEIAALESLYNATGGPGWHNSGGWLDGPATAQWYGVVADSLGRVLELDLAGNNLTGSMPVSVLGLSQLEVLRIGDNPVSGHLPRGLVDLPIRELHYAGTDVCVPDHGSFMTWLAAIPSHQGTGIVCSGTLTDREILEILYHTTGGPGWSESENWLTDAPLKRWHGVDTDAAGRVVELSLRGNWLFDSFGLKGQLPPEIGGLGKLTSLTLGSTELSGPIPPEVGNLAQLRSLYLYNTDLSGPIPPELGNLGNLRWLHLNDNQLSGSIPAELGGLDELIQLRLNGNQLSGPIPPALGALDNLRGLYLQDNRLSDSIPSWLGDLAFLRVLHLDFNQLSGPVPPALSGIRRLEQLTLGGNEKLAGRLPLVLSQLGRLDVLVASDTGLCAPADAPFQRWLSGLSKRRVAACAETVPPAAYLTQAVQSFDYPVPLVAGRRALLRVFPTAATDNSASKPAVRARFYVHGRETRVVDVAGGPGPVSTEIDEGNLASSVNAEIPASVIQPGLELVIEVDPDGALDPTLGVAGRIPETGRMAVEVRRMPVLDLTVIPFVWSETHDSTIVDLVRDMAAAPESHEMLGVTRALLPVGGIEVTAHEPVISSSNRAFDLFRQTATIREMEGGAGHYKGMMSRPVTGAGGVAYLPGRSSFSQPYPGIVAHELGHNLNLAHAPCGGAGGPDPAYPYRDGSIGAWGYDFDVRDVVPPGRPDHMSYCDPTWTSDYYFEAALRFRLEDEGARSPAAAPVRSLLLWGGMGTDSVPFLEPAFVVDAPPSPPGSGGDHRITGTAADGSVLFAFDIGMTEVADGEGRAGFTFLLPVEPAWEARLAAVTLSGPGGIVTLDGDSDRPMVILRDPRSGEVRAFLRDLPPAAAQNAVGGTTGQAAGAGLDVLFSRGLPDAADWRR